MSIKAGVYRSKEEQHKQKRRLGLFNYIFHSLGYHNIPNNIDLCNISSIVVGHCQKTIPSITRQFPNLKSRDLSPMQLYGLLEWKHRTPIIIINMLWREIFMCPFHHVQIFGFFINIILSLLFLNFLRNFDPFLQKCTVIITCIYHYYGNKTTK